jgi:acyl-CoA synthetase (AMP-forming)/AMP-acid ligase II
MAEHAAQRHITVPNYVLPALEFFARMGPAEAIVHGARRYTYAETRAAVLAMATALSGHGMHGDMTVLAVTRNHPDSIILQLALHLLGCRTGFVPVHQPHRDQLSFIEDAGADVLIHDSGLADELISEALARNGRPVLSLGPGDGHSDLLAEMVIAAAGSPPDGGRAAAGAGHEPQALFSPVARPARPGSYYTSSASTRRCSSPPSSAAPAASPPCGTWASPRSPRQPGRCRPCWRCSRVVPLC